MPGNALFAGLPTTVFEVMSQLAREHFAVNLGQGFPDDLGPQDVREHAAHAVVHGNNQYPPMLGVPALREAIAAHYTEWHALSYDPASEIMVTSGATEALAAAAFALIEPGDPVVLFEPMYDAYLPLVLRAGGVPRFVSLAAPAFTLTEDALAAAFAPDATGKRPRLALFNTPQNPATRVYSADELDVLARACVAADAICVCDEVWEHVVFDGRAHVPLASRPGMRERTVKIGSAGKIFSMTGWKVGFVCAPNALLRLLAKAHQYLTFTTPPNLQAAVAFGLGKPREDFLAMQAAHQARRDRFERELRGLGLDVLPSEGTYFLNVDVRALTSLGDVEFCQWLVREHRLATIPVSAFYTTSRTQTLVRFCFAKREETLQRALEHLQRALRQLP